MTYRFLIYISHTYGIPIGEPIEDEINKRGYEVRWFADLPYTQKSLNSKNLLTTIEQVNEFHPHIVLTATDSVAHFIPGIKVQIFHGFLANKHSMRRGHFRIRGFFDLYCTQGPSTTTVFNEKKRKYGYFEVIETGWSKVDPLFPLIPKNVKKKRKPIVLIASTFSQKYSLAYNEEVFKALKELSKTGSFKFICVLHPKITEDIVLKYKSLENENFSYIDTTDLIPLFKKADIMLADTTSAISEFLLQEKPVVTFRNNKPENHLIDIKEVDQLPHALGKALSKPPELMTHIRRYIEDTHPYKDGRSSARLIDATIGFLHKDKSYLKARPFNLIRKYKIRKQLNDFRHEPYNRPITINRNTNSEKITAIIPVYNEALNIEDALRSVDFADEIIVVDSYSTDGTVEIARTMGTRILQREFNYPASQKNWAIPQASHEWILLLDADERVTPTLKAEIQTILYDPPRDINGYWIYRRNHFMGKPVKYSGWQNDKVVRLFRRDRCRYEDKMVHEEIKTDGKLGFLKERLYHNTYVSIDHYLKKLNRYAYWQAIDYDKKTKRLTPFHFFIKPLWRFFKHYVIQQGFRDGFVGFTISYLQSYALVMRYIKLWLYRRGLD